MCVEISAAPDRWLVVVHCEKYVQSIFNVINWVQRVRDHVDMVVYFVLGMNKIFHCFNRFACNVHIFATG